MKLIKTTDNWTCGVVALAMLLDEDVDNLILEIGHNGGEKIWPHLGPPECYKGFNTQEFVDVCYARGYALLGIEGAPVSWSGPEAKPKRIWTPEQENDRMIRYMDGNSGIIIGNLETGARHACAWDGKKVYDPKGFIYDFDSSTPEIVETTVEFYPISVADFLGLFPLSRESNLSNSR